MLKARGPLPRRGVQLGEWFNEQRSLEKMLIKLEQLNRELDCEYDSGREYKEKAIQFHKLYDQMRLKMMELSYKTNYRFELRMEIER